MTTHTPHAAPSSVRDDVADQELKARHRALWALGDYPSIAATVIPSLGGVVARAGRIQPGEKVLDIAAGSGNASIPAAQLGARVVASDLTPELFPAGEAAAAAAGVTIDWQQADAENLPFPDASFDVALSCVGVMFAPHHDAAAAEILRVVRPGGRIALVAWTPEGFVGQMFGVMKPYAAPPPPGAQPPPLWGRPDHVRELFGEHVTDLSFQTEDLVVDCFADGAAFRDFFKKCYGPTVATYGRVKDDPRATAALDEGLAALGDGALGGGSTMPWQYLLTTATRR